MNRLPTALAVLLLTHAAAPAQNGVRLYTRPTPPSAEALDRLHLRMAWRTYVPTESTRDGLFSVQLLDNQIFVQTHSGSVVALDATTGVALWHVRIGQPFKITQRLTANKKSVFAIRSGVLYDIDRTTGQVRWEFRLPNETSAAPGADDEMLFLCLGTGHVYAYMLPEAVKEEKKPGADEPDRAVRDADRTERVNAVRASVVRNTGPLGSATNANQPEARGPQPIRLWDVLVDTRIERPPLLTDDRLVVAGSDGSFVVMSKAQLDQPVKFQTGATLSAPIGHHAALTEDELHLDEIAYVASRDYSLYALDTVKGRPLWRFTAGSPIYLKPEVTDDDVYMTAERTGLYRIDRQSGRLVWQNPEAQRFLSMNKRFVYATDRRGRLLVLDRSRGSVRGVYDASAFVVPVSNEWNDRLFLASNDGLLVCLHDRDYPKPLVTKTVPERRVLADEKTDKKPEAKPKDEAKQDDKAADEPKDKPGRKPLPKPKEVKKKDGDQER